MPFSTLNTTVLVLSSLTCQLGVFAAERGQVSRSGGLLKIKGWGCASGSCSPTSWRVLHRRPGAGVRRAHPRGRDIPSSAYGSVFYLTTGFHGLHVTGGLIAFVFVLGRTYMARKFTHEQAVCAIVVSYYWHFVDVVWIGLFATIYLIK